MTLAINNSCPYCGSIHSTVCHKVKAIEYYQDGTVKRVELMTPSDQYTPIPQQYGTTRPYPLTTTWGGKVDAGAGSHSTGSHKR